MVGATNTIIMVGHIIRCIILWMRRLMHPPVFQQHPPRNRPSNPMEPGRFILIRMRLNCFTNRKRGPPLQAARDTNRTLPGRPTKMDHTHLNNTHNNTHNNSLICLLVGLLPNNTHNIHHNTRNIHNNNSTLQAARDTNRNNNSLRNTRNIHHNTHNNSTLQAARDTNRNNNISIRNTHNIHNNNNTTLRVVRDTNRNNNMSHLIAMQPPLNFPARREEPPLPSLANKVTAPIPQHGNNTHNNSNTRNNNKISYISLNRSNTHHNNNINSHSIPNNISSQVGNNIKHHSNNKHNNHNMASRRHNTVDILKP